MPTPARNSRAIPRLKKESRQSEPQGVNPERGPGDQPSQTLVQRRAVLEVKAGVVVILALAAGIAAFFYRGAPIEAGTETELRFTLVPMDEKRLACRGTFLDGKYRCNRDDQRRVVPVVNTGNHRFLVAGVFADDEVKKRVRTKNGGRFLVACDVRYVAKLDQVEVRFSRKRKWQKTPDIWLVDAQRCKTDTL